MNTNTIKLKLACLILLQLVAISARGKPKKFCVGGQAVADLTDGLDMLLTSAVNVHAQTAGSNLLAGAFSQLSAEKQKEIGAHLAQGFIAEMGTEKGCEAVFHLGESFVQGAAAGAVGVASTASKAVAAKVTATVAAAKTSTIAAASTAKAATIAGATAAAPYVAIAAAVGVVGYGSYKTHRHFAEPVEQYHRCLNDNLGCDDLNDRGFPKACDSLGSGAWNYLGTKSTRESNYKELKARLQAAKEKESC